MKLKTLTQLTALSAALLGSTSFAASNDALLDLLVQKGVLTESEASAVAAELKAEQPTFVTAKGKAVTDLKLTGRLQLQYDNIDGDTDDSAQDGFYFRRIRLGAEAKFFGDYYGQLSLDVGGDSDSDLDLDKAVIGWKYASFANFEGGYTKVPFGLYETTSSARIKTVERSIANRYFVEGDGLAFGGRHTGLFAEGDFGSGFSYSAAVTSSGPSNDRDDDVIDDRNSLSYFGRLRWESSETDIGQLMVGVDAGLSTDGAGNVGKGGAGDGDVMAYGIHANYSLSDFNLSGEALFGTTDNVTATGGDEDAFGFTVIPSYKINDKWEVVGSYSYIETDGGNFLDADDLVRRSNVSGDYEKGESFYTDFNYFIKGNDLKLTGGYEFSTFEDSAGNEVDIDAFRVRLQALF
jgi:phosphate-selective porin